MSEKRVHYMDPEVHSNRRSEFRLHAKCYKNNLKLCLNMSSSGGVFPDIVGAYGLIKHIRLMSGGVELDSCRFANYWMAWKNVNQTNENNRNVRHEIARNALGFSLNPQLVYTTAAPPTLALVGSGDPQAGVINLMECLPLLQSIVIFNTDLIPNLKVVIEYNTDQKLMKKDVSVVGSISPPILVAEEVLDESVISQSAKLPGAVWNAIEHDSFILPAGTAGTVQKVTQKLNGFDNKMVSKIVMMKHLHPVSKNYTGNVPNGFGSYASQVQHKEEYNFVVNSQPVYPRNVNERAEKSMHLSAAWGPVNIVPYANQSSIGGNPNGATIQAGERIGIPFPENSLNDPHPSHKVGGQDYIGVALNTRVNQFEFVYQRLPVTDTGTIKKQTDSLEMKFFALVSKSIKFNSGGPPSVSYV